MMAVIAAMACVALACAMGQKGFVGGRLNVVGEFNELHAVDLSLCRKFIYFIWRFGFIYFWRFRFKDTPRPSILKNTG